MNKGVLLIVCGPSGVGKTSLCDELLADQPHLQPSISYTTREPRGDEVDDFDYHFVTDAEFEQLREEDAFVEWAEVHGHYYGTTRATIERAWESGTDVMFDIDYQGARQLQNAFEEAVSVLVVPPSMEELERRLRGRATDTARHELSQYELFDYIVENDDFDDALADLRDIYHATRHRTPLRQQLLEKLLS